jgi:hypothetical protein
MSTSPAGGACTVSFFFLHEVTSAAAIMSMSAVRAMREKVLVVAFMVRSF